MEKKLCWQRQGKTIKYILPAMMLLLFATFKQHQQWRTHFNGKSLGGRLKATIQIA